MKFKSLLIRGALVLVLLAAVAYKFQMRHEPLAARLVSSNDDTRNMALAELAKLNEKKQAETIAALQASMASADPQTRRFALYGLRKLGGQRPDIIALSVRCLADADKNVREEATVALMGFGPAALPELVALLKDPKNPAAESALRVIEKSGDKAVPSLVSLLSETPATQLMAVRALKRIGKPAKAAEPALSSLLLASSDPAMRLETAEAVDAVGTLPKAAAPILAKDMLSARESYSDASASKPRLTRLLEKVAPRRRELIDLGFDLLQRNPLIRYRAAFVLSETQPSLGALEMLVDALEDKDVTVAARAMVALTKIGLDKTARLKKTAVPRVRRLVQRAQDAKIEGFNEIVQPALASLPN